MADDKEKRPEATQGKGKSITTVKELLAAPATLERFRAYAPKALDAERLFKIAMLAVNNAPLLAEASPMELLRSMMAVTSLGLEINSPLQHAFLIPFKRRDNSIQIQVIIGYPGFLELCYRSKMVSSFSVNVATKNEVKKGLFTYKLGTNEFIDHQYDPDRDEDEDEPAYAYSVVTMADGRQKIDVRPWKAVLRIRDSSAGFIFAKAQGKGSKTYLKNPWVAHSWAMGMKTSLRQIVKLLPRTTDMALGMALDELGERGNALLEDVFDLDPSDWATEAKTPTNDRPAAEKPKPAAKPKPAEKKQPAKTEDKPKPDAETKKPGPEAEPEPSGEQEPEKEHVDESTGEVTETEPEAEPEAEAEAEAEPEAEEDETETPDGWF